MTPLPLLDHIRAFTGGVDQSPCDGCDGCGARCTAGVRMLREEFEEIRDLLAALPQEEVERVLGQSKQVTVPGTEYAYTACEFRDVERGRCLVYPARPAICRLFGHVEWLPCPIEKVEKMVPGGVALMRFYATESLRTYGDWLTTDCSHPLRA